VDDVFQTCSVPVYHPHQMHISATGINCFLFPASFSSCWWRWCRPFTLTNV